MCTLNKSNQSQICYLGYKTLGTSVIYGPMSPYILDLIIESFPQIGKGKQGLLICYRFYISLSWKIQYLYNKIRYMIFQYGSDTVRKGLLVFGRWKVSCKTVFVKITCPCLVICYFFCKVS